jgi:mono/diheme cytochrome c family protein
VKRLRLGASLAVLLALPTAGAWAADKVEAGRYQAVLGDCVSCHTADDGKPFAGGRILATPFGKLATSNITSDMDTGIGGWSEEDFRRAMKEGVAPGGKRLYPAMPYPAYSRMTDADVSALWAYMKTIKPVSHKVETNLLPFPFNIRTLLAGWNWLNFKPVNFVAEPGKSATWNRGAYLVTGAAHCGACHTPKSLLGADKADQHLAGGSLEGWFAPDITPNKAYGISNWSIDDIIAYLRTGWNKHAVASGPMAEAVENSTSQMTATDLVAIAVYLKDQPASVHATAPIAVAAGDPQMKAGETVYQNNCTSCHGWDGKGEGRIFPTLAGNNIVRQDSAETLVRIVLAGAQAAHTHDAPTAPSMPSFAWRLNDTQVADLLTYVRNSWGNKGGAVSADAVAKARPAHS